jgi:hypothetical protein
MRHILRCEGIRRQSVVQQLNNGTTKRNAGPNETVRTENCGGLEERKLVHRSKGGHPMFDGRLNIFSVIAHNANSIRVGQGFDYQAPGYTTTPLKY